MQSSEPENTSRARPFSAERTKVVACKIIFFYSIFYIVMKILAVLNNAWLVANLLLCIPFILFGLIGFWMNRNNKYSWTYLILGVLIISAIRFFEKDLLIYFHQQL